MTRDTRPTAGVFISYRRSDTAPYARLLRQELRQRFGAENVFVDVDSIAAGADFAEAIRRAIDGCGVLLALVGARWLSATGGSGGRRLDDPEDVVRLEIEAALGRGVQVIPVLVDGAQMPRSDELPAALAPLARRSALELSFNRRYEYELGLLIAAIEQVLGPAGPAGAPPRREPVGAGYVDRLSDAITQLGRAEDGARLAGLYAITTLGDEWIAGRQKCLDVICRHLRLWSEESSDSSDGRDRCFDVALSMIGERFGQVSERRWSGCDVDLSRVCFDGVRIVDWQIDTTLTLSGSTMSGGGLVLEACTFWAATVHVSPLTIADGGELEFLDCRFDGSRLVGQQMHVGSGSALAFTGCEITDGCIDLSGSRVVGGSMRFESCLLQADGRDARGYSDALVDLRRVEMSAGCLSFVGSRFTEDAPIRPTKRWWRARPRRRVRWNSCVLSLFGAKLSGGRLDFTSAEFVGGEARLCHLAVDDCAVSFEHCVFADGLVDFSRAVLTSGTLRFGPSFLRSCHESEDIGVPSWLVRWFQGVDGRRSHSVRLPQAGLPMAALDFTDARIDDAVLDFRGMIGQNGLVDFKGAVLGGPGRILFDECMHGGPVVVFWRIKPTGADFKVVFESPLLPFIVIALDRERSYRGFLAPAAGPPLVGRQSLAPLDLQRAEIFAVDPTD